MTGKAILTTITTCLPLKIFLFIVLFTVSQFTALSQPLPGFTPAGTFNEQELNINNHWKEVIININAPSQLNHSGKTYLIFFALPNGNSIEWTKGKKLQPGDDWHFDIQHIRAQTKFIRQQMKKKNFVVIYLENNYKSWPAWKQKHPGYRHEIPHLIDSLAGL